MPLDLAIGFSRTNSFVSKAMQWFMHAKISHTFIAVTLNDKIRFTIGVDDRGLHWQSWKLFTSKSEIVAVFKPTGPCVDSHFWWAMDKYGDTDYDYVAAGAIGLRNRLTWLWRLVKGVWRKRLDPDKLTCMELITRMLKRADYSSVKDVDAEMHDTQQLMQRMFMAIEEYRVEYVSDIIKEEPYVRL